MYLNAKVIFDNGGGVTLQLGTDYAHYYASPTQAAEDYALFHKNGNTDGWEGNEKESKFEPTIDKMSNGGYKVCDEDDINKLFNEYETEGELQTGWINVREFVAALNW